MLNNFPFDMSDFVTVDEVGDVADLSLKSSEGGDNPPTSIQQDSAQVYLTSMWLYTNIHPTTNY